MLSFQWLLSDPGILCSVTRLENVCAMLTEVLGTTLWPFELYGFPEVGQGDSYDDVIVLVY